MGTVEAMVARVAKLGQPGLALTDHGTMAGSIRLYKECQKRGLAAFPGTEAYVVRDVSDTAHRERRYHMGMLALDYRGYQALLKLSTLSHQRDRFFRKPLIDLSDLAALSDSGDADHIAVTTGCHFGLVMQAMYERIDQPYEARMALNRMIKMLATWFPHTFVEVQRHGIDVDGHNDSLDYVLLMEAAKELGLPVVFGQDSHYCLASHQPVHDLMKSICYFGDGEDFAFPGGPYHLASSAELQALGWAPGQWDRIEEGHAALLDLNRLSLPALDAYKFHVPEISGFPMKQLERKCEAGADKRKLIVDDSWSPNPYRERLLYELRVIKTMGMANYFLLIEEATDWCRRNHVIVQARGSANGSLVCYLLGITEVDPIRWGTDFDRFLSVDRKKPPDIDLDIESSKRGVFIEWLKHRHPNMVHIGTYGRLGVTEEDNGDGITEDKGSAIVQYMAAMKRRDKNFAGRVLPEHRQALNKLSDMKVRKSLGVHAAGIVLPAVDHPVGAYLATALVASSNTTVTQMPMDDVEEAGYVKGDFLGLKQLETLNGALVNIGKAPNDWDWMPWDDPKACKTLRSGNCLGIFQFEGPATTRGGREMGVKSTLDAIICLALYRPALMNGGQKDQYLHNRKNKRVDHVRLHKTFDKILDVTAGVPIFQEQVMQICKHLGMGYEDWNELIKAVKASNDKISEYALDTFAKIKPVFLRLCVKHGMTVDEAAEVWGAVVGFSDYGFNRAHATGYGITAYRSAYLKAHHPLEFMQSLLTVWVGTKKERLYVAEARRLGITIARCDVNISGAGWVIDPRQPMKLRKGLLSLDGIGANVAEAIIAARPPGGWQTMEDFISAVPGKPVSGGKDYARTGALIGKMAVLRDAGALQSLGVQ